MNKPITLCDRCDIYMSCLLDYDGILCRKNRTVEPTNADCIRAMTDEELANEFAKIEGDPYNGATIGGWLDWLKKERE